MSKTQSAKRKQVMKRPALAWGLHRGGFEKMQCSSRLTYRIPISKRNW
jgi:hypothetical protein